MLSIRAERGERLAPRKKKQGTAGSPVHSPGGIKDFLILAVSVSSTWQLAGHLSWKRRGLFVAGLLVALLLAVASLHIRTGNQPANEPGSACNAHLSICIGDGAVALAEPSHPELQSSSGIWKAYSSAAYDSPLKIALHVIGTFSLALIAIAAIYIPPTLFKVHVVFLAPYEQFPVISSKLQLSKNDHIYAVRLLSDGARNRFRDGLLSNGSIDQNFANFTSLSLTSDKPTELLRRRRFPIKDYSCLVRHALIQLLPHTRKAHGSTASNETIKALYFTYKQHRTTLRIYIFLLIIAILAPINFDFQTDESFQFPLLMATLGVFWSIATAFIHRVKGRHLDEWEFKTLGDPFNGCPVFRYSKTESVEEHWHMVPPEEFHARITSFGVDHNTLQQWILAGLLVVYLTILQLIK